VPRVRAMAWPPTVTRPASRARRWGLWHRWASRSVPSNEGGGSAHRGASASGEAEEGFRRRRSSAATRLRWAVVRNRGCMWGRGYGHVGHCVPNRVGQSEMNSDISKYSKKSNGFKLIRLKDGLPLLEKSQIKYGIEGFEERNNFLHRNFFRFKLDFE
jgi:hypothetical protein